VSMYCSRSRCVTPSTVRGSRGFTFLEILIALCVVLLALVPLMRLQVVSVRMMDTSSRRARAVLLANDKLAEIMAQEATDLGTSNGRMEDADSSTVYHWTASVADACTPETGSAPAAGIRQVRVEVGWRDSGRDVIVSLDTFIHVPVVNERQILRDTTGGKGNPKLGQPLRFPPRGSSPK